MTTMLESIHSDSDGVVQTNRVISKCIYIWLVFRTITSIVAGFASTTRIPNAQEQIIAWPPTAPLGDWLYQLLIIPWLRWDTHYFLQIVKQGYQTNDGTAQFHPLFPVIATVISKLGSNPLFSLLFVSSLASIALVFVFILLYQIDNSDRDFITALMLFLSFPTSYVIFAPYSESLFLLFAILSVYFARKGHWWLAGISGALATLTRQQGIFLLIPLAIELWQEKRGEIKCSYIMGKRIISLSLIPSSYLAWILARKILLNDYDPDFGGIQSFIYSILISPSSAQVVQFQAFLLPWESIFLAIHKVLSSPDLDIYVNLLFAGYFIFLIVLSWKKLRLSYRVYTLVIILLSLSYHTGSIHPYMGLLRHLSLAFPVFLVLPKVLAKPSLRLFIFAINTIGFLSLEWFHIIGSWVP